MQRTVALSLLLILSAAGCGDDAGDPPKNTRVRTLADALMQGVHFKNGVIKSGDLGASDDEADKLQLAAPDGLLQLEPADSSIMSLSIEHPDREPALAATLMQFEGSEDHIEVEYEPPSGSGSSSELDLELEFDVDGDICEGLCNQRYAGKVIIAVQLEGGAISQHIELSLVLDCSETGDEDLCEDAPPPAPIDAGAISTPPPKPSDAGVDSGTDAAGDTGDAGMDAAATDSAVEDSGSDAGPSEPPPQLTLVTPGTTAFGSALTVAITGTGFAPDAVAYLNGEPLPTEVIDETALEMTVTAQDTQLSGSLAIYVDNVEGDLGSRSNVLYLQVAAAPGAPVVYDYSPDNGVAGDTILIIASNLEGQTLTIEDAEGHALEPGPVGTISWPTGGAVHTVQVILPDDIASGPITVANPLGSYRAKIFSVGRNLTRLEGTLLESSSQYNAAQWGRASGGDNLLATSFFTMVGDCATNTSCTIDPWYKITFPSPQTVGRIAMRGNREYASGYDFLRGRFEVLGEDDAVLWEGSYDLPAPDRDLDITLPEPVEDAIAVRFWSLADEGTEPGFSELEVFGP